MNIDIKDIITLDDDIEYVVASKINYKNKNYYYLIDINDNTNIKFCYEEDKYLVLSEDKELNTLLLPLFFKEGYTAIMGINSKNS